MPPPVITYATEKILLDNKKTITPRYTNCVDVDKNIQCSYSAEFLKTINQTSLKMSISNVVKTEIEDCYRNCSEANWDCYGASPLSRQAVDNSIKFIYFIENIKKKPSISPMSTSDISLTWKNNSKIFSIAFTEDNKILYASSNEDNFQSGSFIFDETNIKTVCSFLESFVNE